MPPARAIAAFGLLIAAACGVTTAGNGQDPTAVFRYDRSLPLHPDSVRQPDDGTRRLYRIGYDSPDGGRVTGYLAVPASAGRHAAVLLLHGLPGTAEGAMSLLGLDLAARGAVALAIDAPWVRRGGLPDFTVRDSVEQVQLMKDLQRGVDFLLARQDVDSSRIGYVGGSYGGAMGSLFVGIEHRLHAAILFVPDGGLVEHFTNADGSFDTPLSLLSRTDRDRWLAAMQPIEPITFVGRSSPTPLLIQSARQDQLVSADDAQALQAAAGMPKEIIWYDSGHGLGSFPAAREDRARFFEEQLGIPRGQ